MKRVMVKTGMPYEVLIGHGLLADAGRLVREVIAPCRALIVTDSHVAPLYLDTVRKSLADAGFSVSAFVFPAGEEQKNISTLTDILTALADAGLTRTDLAVALGGGVTGDMTGLAASLYLRGIRCVQIPTTLLAAVDSSVGGKTAIDFAGRKNIVGAFYQPTRVLCDLDTFDTLSPDIFRDGLAESIKYGVICDDRLFRLFETAEILDMTEIVSACVAHKARIVEQDEHDLGLRQLLNFGHTAGHAIEACSGYTISHGHAVAMGMALIARAAARAGITQDDTADRIKAVLARYGLPTVSPYSAADLAAAALADKKRRGGSITLIVPVKMGTCAEHRIPVEELESFFALGMEADL